MSARLAALLWIACACLLVLGAGCTRQGCPGCAVPDPLLVPSGAEGSVSCPYQVTHLDFSGMSTPPTLLVLSGGASHGAWGAGVITGWKNNPTEPRPDFTVVTGISVGALQATPAFLGNLDPQYDARLEQFFTTSKDSDIFTWNLLGGNGLQSREPLKQKIEQYVTKEVVLKVAQQNGRELYVGTVNMDTSEFCPWNLSTIARKAEAAPDNSWEEGCWVNLFQKAIFAASGAPVIAPPVRINSNACTGGPDKSMLHADGGVRARVFIGQVIQAAKAASNPSNRPTAYVIVNGKPVTHPECMENSLLPIAQRTFDIMDHEAIFGSLHALMTETQSLTQTPTINLKLSWIPDDYCLRFPGTKFDPALMTCLYRKGQAFALPPSPQPIPWATTVPPASAVVWPPGSQANPCCRPMGKCTGQTCTSPQCTGKICVAPPGCPP